MSETGFRQLLEREQLAREAFLRDAFLAIAFNQISGAYAEFGSHGGNTFRLAYTQSREYGIAPHLWAFDSFKGLPPNAADADPHPQWIEGKMATSEDQFRALCVDHGIPEEEFTTVAGFFADTLGALGDSQEPTDIALAYVDCDLYTSTRDVLRFLEPRLKAGMILAFDDYFAFSSDRPSGERTAFLEVQGNQTRWRFVPFARFGWAGQAFVVEPADV